MRKLKIALQDGLSAFVLPVVLLAGAILPTTSLANEELFLDRGRLGGREGDPLDTNDYGGDGDPDDNVQDATGASAGRNDLLLRLLKSSRVLLVPQYNGTTLTFKVIVLSEATDSVEARHAK